MSLNSSVIEQSKFPAFIETRIQISLLKGENREALELLDQFQQITPELKILKGDICSKLWEHARAAELYQEAAEKLKDSPGLNLKLAIAYYLNGQWEPAQKFLSKAIQKRPEEGMLQLFMALILLEDNQSQKALNMVSSLHDKLSLPWLASFVHSCIQLELNGLQKAQEALDKAPGPFKG